ncbi:MAG TPA: biopolymer transporter ExbD [Elusimicrobiota bacterium]|jgi:biopolymer transport protein TolR|nr:biopolymer transporter ExbD [Elusimicrobiota bacterium]
MAYALLRLRSGESQAEPVTEVNIIPVIDISLVLLVILFVTAPMLSYPSDPVDLPRATGESGKDDGVTVTCTKELKLAVGSAVVDREGLPEALSRELAKKPDAPVVLRVDRSVPYREVQKLILAAKKGGARALSLAIEPHGR